MSSEALNLEAITTAMDQHDRNCDADLVAIEMNAFEIERLGWDEIRGVPLRAADMGSGRFRLVCSGDEAPVESLEAVSQVPV